MDVRVRVSPMVQQIEVKVMTQNKIDKMFDNISRLTHENDDLKEGLIKIYIDYIGGRDVQSISIRRSIEELSKKCGFEEKLNLVKKEFK